MSASDLLAALTGATGALVLSLVVNYLQATGRLINPDKVVRRADYDAIKVEQSADRLLLQKAADGITKLARRRPAARG